MTDGGSCLGICYADNQLYYAVKTPGQDNLLHRIGCIDFNFDVREAITTNSHHGFPILSNSLHDLKKEYDSDTLRVLIPATQECWSIVPRSVYEVASEREAHIRLLMRFHERSAIETTWHPVSKSDSQLLVLRDHASVSGFESLMHSFGNLETVSDFELSHSWHILTKDNGAFIMVHCQHSYISIASYVLGKLRSCTYFRYDYVKDLPYLWNLYAANMPWLSGIHDNIFIFGHTAKRAAEQLTPYWHDHGTLTFLDSLDTMQVSAAEKTYGFQLESAFPAILMSLNV